jgi:ABC-type branched-subunit amino acid transport system ATPase component
VWFSVKDVRKSFGGVLALDGVSFKLSRGEILGLVGPNGAGKTTLFNVISGFDAPDCGRINLSGTELVGLPPYLIALAGLVRTFQVPRLIENLTVIENVLLFCKSQPGERLRNVFFSNARLKAFETEIAEKAKDLLQKAGLGDKMLSPASELSYGQLKLLTIACCIASDSDLLLLDEPIAGVAPVMIDRILEMISDLRSAEKSVILIEHNMDAIMHVCSRVLFLDVGSVVCDGVPSDIRSNSRVIDAYLR